ncbi:MAG: hypothetical protein ACRC0A_07725 [Chitinophagaceae bacterium]
MPTFPANQRILQDAVASYNRLILEAQGQSLEIHTPIRIFLEKSLDISVPYKKIGQYIEFPVVVDESSAIAIQQGDAYDFQNYNGTKAVTKVVEYANPQIVTQDIMDMLKEAKEPTDFDNIWSSQDFMVRGSMNSLIKKIQNDVFNTKNANSAISAVGFFQAFSDTTFMGIDPTAGFEYWKADIKDITLTGNLTDTATNRGTLTVAMNIINELKIEAKKKGGVLEVLYVYEDFFNAIRDSLSIAGSNKNYTDKVDVIEYDNITIVLVSEWTDTTIYGTCKNQYKVALNNDDLLMKDNTFHQEFNIHKGYKFTPSVAIQWYPEQRRLLLKRTIKAAAAAPTKATKPTPEPTPEPTPDTK